MIIRTKRGEMRAAGDVNSLFALLGIKQGAVGVQKVESDVDLIASVPFQMSNEEKKSSFAWTLSTFDLDRFGERIDPQGWDFTRFLLNPVVQWAHNFLIPAIGKIEGLSVDDNGLHGAVVFNDKAFDAFGWGIGQRVEAGVIRAGSVGFRVVEIEIPSKADSKDGTSLIFRKQELLEFSICNVPANPYALCEIKNKKEELTMNNEIGNSAVQFWSGLINEQLTMSNEE